MNQSRSRTMPRILSALAAAFALTFVVASAPETRAETATAPAAKTLPLKPAFHKDKKAEAGQYVLSLKNTSDQPVKVSAEVLLAVAFHATDKARKIPEETIAPGKFFRIRDLATDDKVTIKADGYDPLTLVVPASKKKKE